MKLVLDNHYSGSIALKLLELGHDVVTAREKGWETEDDESLLVLCKQQRAALLTNNAADFAVIVRRWAAEGSGHSGIIYSSDASMPRNRGTIGRYVTALDRLLRANPSQDAFADDIHWL